MSDTVTVKECSGMRSKLHDKINQRATWSILRWVLGGFFILILGSFAYTSASVGKVSEKQWEAAEKMVTKEDLRAAEERIMDALRALGQ